MEDFHYEDDISLPEGAPEGEPWTPIDMADLPPLKFQDILRGTIIIAGATFCGLWLFNWIFLSDKSRKFVTLKELNAKYGYGEEDEQSLLYRQDVALAEQEYDEVMKARGRPSRLERYTARRARDVLIETAVMSRNKNDLYPGEPESQQQQGKRAQEGGAQGAGKSIDELLDDIRRLEQRSKHKEALEILMPLYEGVRDRTDAAVLPLKVHLEGKIGNFAYHVRDYATAYEFLKKNVEALDEMLEPEEETDEVHFMMAQAYLNLGKSCTKLDKLDEADGYLEAGLECAPDDPKYDTLIGYLWLAKGALAETRLERVPIGELPEVLELGMAALRSAHAIFKGTDPKFRLTYTAKRQQFSLLITVGRMREACDIQEEIIESMTEAQTHPILIAREKQYLADILFDMGAEEESEEQVKECLAIFETQPDAVMTLFELKNDYAHKYLYPSGRAEEARRLFDEIRAFSEGQAQTYLSECSEVRVRSLEVTPELLQLELQLKRTIAERKSRLPADTEIRMSVSNWTDEEPLRDAQGADQWSAVVTPKQRESNNREERRQKFLVEGLPLQQGRAYIAKFQLFKPGASEPFAELRQLLLPNKGQ